MLEHGKMEQEISHKLPWSRSWRLLRSRVQTVQSSPTLVLHKRRDRQKLRRPCSFAKPPSLANPWTSLLPCTHLKNASLSMTFPTKARPISNHAPLRLDLQTNDTTFTAWWVLHSSPTLGEIMPSAYCGNFSPQNPATSNWEHASEPQKYWGKYFTWPFSPPWHLCEELRLASDNQARSLVVPCGSMWLHVAPCFSVQCAENGSNDVKCNHCNRGTKLAQCSQW